MNNIYIYYIRRTPGFVEFLAAALKASKVLFPVVGALMEPTIPGHIVNIKNGWERD